MNIFAASEKFMRMSEKDWARHASPWSCFSRISCLPLISAAIWSREWLGWYSLIPLSLALLWTWLNPRLFPAPPNLESWAARSTLGERCLINSHNHPVPGHHRRMAHILSGVTAAGLVPLVIGLILQDIATVLLGLAVVITGKLWFLDRMVWLYEDMRKAQ